MNFISVACHAVSWHFPALPFAHVSSLHLLERPFTARTPFLQFFSSLHFSSVSLRNNFFPFPSSGSLRVLPAFSSILFLSSAFFMLFPLHFPQAPCFASPACIASSASSGMVLAMLGVLSSIRHPLKMLVFGRCGEVLQKSSKIA